MEQQRNDQTEAQNKLAVMPVGRLLLSLAMPAIAAQIVNLLYNMVDRIYIGHIKGIGGIFKRGIEYTHAVSGDVFENAVYPQPAYIFGKCHAYHVPEQFRQQ